MMKQYTSGQMKASFWGGFAMGVLIAIAVGIKAEEIILNQQFNQEAVKVGAAKWIADEQGKPQFKWLVCTALGVKQ